MRALITEAIGYIIHITPMNLKAFGTNDFLFMIKITGTA